MIFIFEVSIIPSGTVTSSPGRGRVSVSATSSRTCTARLRYGSAAARTAFQPGELQIVELETILTYVKRRRLSYPWLSLTSSDHDFAVCYTD